jgi:16S rRNA (uracil1498-N3)-methyltransferase
LARSFWLPPESRQDDWLRFPPEETHHLLHVLRKRAGDRVEVLWRQERMLVELVGDASALKGRILEERLIPPSPFALDMAQALPKGRKMEQVISLASQVGVRRLIPVQSARSLVRLDGAERLRKLERWQRLAEEEAKITGTFPLAVEAPVSLSEALDRGREADLKLFCWENADRPLLDVLAKAPSSGTCFLVIGPEGGFAPDEADSAERSGFQLISLGERVFRTEIAGLVAAVLLLQHGGAFRLAAR